MTNPCTDVADCQARNRTFIPNYGERCRAGITVHDGAEGDASNGGNLFVGAVLEFP